MAGVLERVDWMNDCAHRWRNVRWENSVEGEFAGV